MTKLITMFMVARHFGRNDRGATAIEYGLIAGMVSIVIIAALALVGPQLTAVFTKIATALTPPA